ncbi:MAG TPA: adenosylmethionine decarboxylase [Cyclobacteriaceae bacterium]|nr:adenosylmethionine decarboxylase [Cyclobacteriaceae bacterium]
MTQPSSSILPSGQLSGLHILANLHSDKTNQLTDYTFSKEFLDSTISKFGLTKVGEVYHAFPGGGFTGVVCLTESHISLHTWPEFNYITLDIFLSNYLKDNTSTTRKFYEEIVIFFNANIIQEHFITR